MGLKVHSPFFCLGQNTDFFLAAVWTPIGRSTLNQDDQLAVTSQVGDQFLRSHDVNVNPKAMLWASDKPALDRWIESVAGYRSEAFRIGFIPAHAEAMAFDEDWERHITLVPFILTIVLEA